MAKHEYFIDEDSKRRCEDKSGKIINAVDIPPVFSLEKNEIIRVTQRDIDHSERRFCFLTVMDEGVFTTMTLIKDGSEYLTSELSGIVFRDNLFACSLSWKTRTGDIETLVGLFYDDEAQFKFDGIRWTTVGPSACMLISTSHEHGGSAYKVSYNHFEFPEPCGLTIVNGMRFYKDFGIDWLANALDYRSSIINKKD